ncbi:26862_t:CDS:1, partial [Dentiscutata erythropus]
CSCEESQYQYSTLIAISSDLWLILLAQNHVIWIYVENTYKFGFTWEIPKYLDLHG